MRFVERGRVRTKGCEGAVPLKSAVVGAVWLVLNWVLKGALRGVAGLHRMRHGAVRMVLLYWRRHVH